MDRWQVLFLPHIKCWYPRSTMSMIHNILIHDIHNPECLSTISLSTIPRYPQVCDHDPQYLYPQYPQYTMSMTHNILIHNPRCPWHNILINDIYDPRCHCPWSTMSLSMSTLYNIHEDQQHQMLINKTLVGINIVNYAMQWRPQEVSFPQIVVKRCWWSFFRLLYHPLNYFS